MEKPLTPKNNVLLSCMCETEFVEFNRETFYDEPAETYLTLYHCNTDIKMNLLQKLYACWSILTKGRSIIYDFILSDAELEKLKEWVNSNTK